MNTGLYQGTCEHIIFIKDKTEAVMNIVLLSGGSGKRLWPLSNDIRSKQFIKMFKYENGEY